MPKIMLIACLTLLGLTTVVNAAQAANPSCIAADNVETAACGPASAQIRAALRAQRQNCFETGTCPPGSNPDLNADNKLTRDPNTGQPTDPRIINGEAVFFDDVWYPAIQQEFTYMLMQNNPPVPNGPNKPEPIFGQAGGTQMVFPVGQRKGDLFGPDGQIDADNGAADTTGYGLTSLDATFDGTPDIVSVDSELTLFQKTGLAAEQEKARGVLAGLRTGVVDVLVVDLPLAQAVLQRGSQSG